VRKDNIRDYATAAFRFYAANCKAPVFSSEAEREDYNAVAAVVQILTQHKEPHALDVVKAVYFAHPDKPLHCRDISDRVIKATFAYGICERKIYTLLAEARRLFARERGLRIKK
jgi:hypothetical protein